MSLQIAFFIRPLFCRLRDTVQKQLNDVERDKLSGVTVRVQDDSLLRFVGFVEGPEVSMSVADYHVCDSVVFMHSPCIR